MRSYILIVLSALLFIPTSGTGVALCIGADGHVALESARNGKCCQTGPSAVEVAYVLRSSFGNPDDCGICTDLVVGGLSRSEIAPASLGRGIDTQTIPPCALTRLAETEPRLELPRISPRTPFQASTVPHALLCTVVLLT
jgi:hypothetical protein